VPLVHPQPRGTGNSDQRGLLTVAIVRPLVFVTVAFAACTFYLIFAADAARAGGLAGSAGGLLYVVLGVSGLVAVLAQQVVAAFGAERMAAGCLGAFGAALGILGSANQSLWAVLVSAVVLGSAFTTGSAVLDLGHPGLPCSACAGFTALFVSGAISPIVTPARVGAWLTFHDLSTALLIGAALTGVTAGFIAVARRRE